MPGGLSGAPGNQPATQRSATCQPTVCSATNMKSRALLSTRRKSGSGAKDIFHQTPDRSGAKHGPFPSRLILGPTERLAFPGLLQLLFRSVDHSSRLMKFYPDIIACAPNNSTQHRLPVHLEVEVRL